MALPYICLLLEDSADFLFMEQEFLMAQTSKKGMSC